MPSMQESVNMFQRSVEKAAMEAKEHMDVVSGLQLGLQLVQMLGQRVQQLEEALKAAGVPLPGGKPGNVVPMPSAPEE